MASKAAISLVIAIAVLVLGTVFWIYPAYVEYQKATEQVEIAKQNLRQSVEEFNSKMSELRTTINQLPPYTN